MFLRVKSPPEELAEVYAQEKENGRSTDSVEVFLSDRNFERGELIHELSHELAEVRLNYEEVCARLKVYEPNFEPRYEAPYQMEDRHFKNK